MQIWPLLRERPLHGHVRRAVEIRVAQHDHRVLAAQLERDRDQPLGGLHGDLPAGGGRAGEVDHVDVVDERGTGAARAGHHREDVGGRAALERGLAHHQVRQRRDLARLQHDRVAGHQRRDAVTEAVGQRVVPRPDHADDAVRAIADHHLLAEQQRRVRLDLLVGQVLGRVLRPEAQRVADVEHLRQQRVLARLAVLLHEHVEHAVAVLDEPVPQLVHDVGAAVEPERLPAGLRAPRALDHGLHLRRSSCRRPGRSPRRWPGSAPRCGRPAPAALRSSERWCRTALALTSGRPPGRSWDAASLRPRRAHGPAHADKLRALRRRASELIEGDAWDYSTARPRSSPDPRAASAAPPRSCSRPKARR